MSGITVFYAHKKISTLSIDKSRKTIYISLIIVALTVLSIALHLIFIERYDWDFDVTYEEYIFRRIMWYIGRTVSISIIALYMAYFAIQKEKEKELETEIHHLRISFIKNKYIVLKEQINPGFLFNSINTLNKLIPDDPSGAKLFLNSLSKLLRNSITQTELNPVEKEIELINSLIIVYKFETETGFNVQNEISSSISHQQVPTLIISNLISFVHKRHHGFQQISSTLIRLTNNERSIMIEIKSMGIETDSEFGILCKQLSERYQSIKNYSITILTDSNTIKLSLPF